MTTSPTSTGSSALDRARRKAFRRLLPVLFLAYFIAYVDRNNVAFAALTMPGDLPWFDSKVFGQGAAMFFIGYLLLEIPGTLIVERWSARKWICRIMVSWGFMAALTAAVNSPFQFYAVRFLLGLAEAGFFPGVIVYLTHWFPVRDRAKALSYFLIATPVAQMVNPLVSKWILLIGSYEINRTVVMPADRTAPISDATVWVKPGTTQVIEGTPVLHPELLGLEGWQWVYIFWAIPAIVLGIGILWLLTDKPHQAKWLTDEEREALTNELAREKAEQQAKGKRMTLSEALSHPKVLLLTLAYFCVVTASYGIEFFMPKIINEWYHLSIDNLVWLIILPPVAALVSQLTCAWSSDHFKERRYHAIVPLLMGSLALGLLPFTQGNLAFTIVCFMMGFAGFKGYMPAFWSLPNLFLVEAAAAGSIGLINSFGNLGGFFGPTIIGKVHSMTGSYNGSLWFLSGSMLVTAAIIFSLGLGNRAKTPSSSPPEPVTK